MEVVTMVINVSASRLMMITLVAIKIIINKKMMVMMMLLGW